MAPWLMLNFILSPYLQFHWSLINKSFFILGLSASLLQLFGFLYLPQILANDTNQLYSVFQWVSWSQVAISIIILFYLIALSKNMIIHFHNSDSQVLHLNQNFDNQVNILKM